MSARKIVAIGIDPGLTGAVAALAMQPRRMAIASAIGAHGYYRGVAAGQLAISQALGAIEWCLDDLAVQGVDVERCEIWGCVEQPGLWEGRKQGAARVSRVSADQRTWRNALDLRCSTVLPDWQAQKIDRRAGLRRSTVGRRGRKQEVRLHNLRQIDAGVLPEFGEIPAGCRVPSDGVHDAVLIALAVLRTANGGAL
jgi:hypothetical protein